MLGKRLRGFFITGTDTGVGKTAVCAGLMRLLHPRTPAIYWKPVQTGFPEDDDTRTVKKETGLSADCFEDPVYRFQPPLSPHLAADREGTTIDVELMTQRFHEMAAKQERVIVEGAGGLFVPYRPGFLQVHLVKKLRLAAIVVVADRLGAINHTLLTIEACRRHQIAVAGVLLNLSTGSFGNAESIAIYGQVRVLGCYKKQSSIGQLVQLMEKDERLYSSLASYL